jgi:L-cysteine S-thiosulfotransferase
MIRRRMAAAVLAAGVALGASGQSSPEAEIAKYREALAAGNPADLWEARGEALWKQKRGPKNASLEACDLGKGPGVVKGAYAELPRYFADADRVMDLETRLAHCMVTLQGFRLEEATKRVFGAGTNRSDFESLAAWISSESRGVTMNVALGHAKEREAYQLGEKLFFFRGGPHDFACATCHGENGKRIRLQDLPNLTDKAGAQLAYTTWPAYRVSQGELRTFQWRLNDCYRQQRFPDLKFASDASIALTTFLARNANGAAFNAPAIKR